MKVYQVAWGGYTWSGDYGIFSTRDKAIDRASVIIAGWKANNDFISDEIPTPEKMVIEVELDKIDD